MTRRHTSRRSRPQKQIKLDLVDKQRLADFKDTFPQAVAEICNLAPLKTKPQDILDNFLLTVEEIVGLAQRRMN